MKASLLALALAPIAAHAQDYFQQRVDYTIAVRLDDERHLLHAQESFVYMNNSPRTLDTLWLHLWPNAYKDQSTALCRQLDAMGDLKLHFATPEERGHIDSLDFQVDGVRAAWGHHARHIDIGWVKLPEPVRPGGSVTVSTPFRVKIPEGKFSRLGRTGQAYYITQWYPKPAVFDKDGWHPMPYLTQGEFYSEFGNFDVRITLPANYVVGATGMLQDAAERAWMDSLAAAPYGDARRFKVEFQREALNAFPPSSSSTKTIRYVQDHVHDFAWFADKRFIVRKGGVTLPKSARRVSTWAMFTPKNAFDWAEAITYVNEAVRFYSEHVGEYPYDACTAVDGTISAGGGMEYPMITIIGEASGAALDKVIAHEVGHNWFYGILGSNERDYAWMDEGMNTFLELRYMRARYPGRASIIVDNIPGFLFSGRTIGQRDALELGYRLNARRNLDQPLSLTSSEFTSANYGSGVYMKTGLIMDHLMAYLGEETMDKCLRAYFDEWKFKHPRPEDVRKVFERESGKDLGWVFDGLIGTDRKLNVQSRRLRGNEFSYRVEGGILAPFPVHATTTGSATGITRWVEPAQASGTALLPEGPWTSARIDPECRTLDIDRHDNGVRVGGLFKRRAPLRVNPLFGVEREDAHSLFYLPLPVWNQHDGWQVGVALHNMGFPSKRTEWAVAPLYSFMNARVGGAGRIEHHFDRLSSRVFQNIALGLSARSQGIYSDPQQGWVYEKVSPHVRFDFKRSPLSRPWKHSMLLRGAYLNTRLDWVRDPGEFPPGPRNLTEYSRFMGELRYTAVDDRKLGPTRIEASVQAQMEDDDPEWAGRFTRASLEASRGFTYNERGKQLRLRAFGGAFLYTFLAPRTTLEAWSLSWGPEDIFFDHAYFDRGRYHTGFFGRQFSKQQGAFKTPFRGAVSDTWTASLNAELDLPFRLPLALFSSVGWSPYTLVQADGSRSTRTATFWEAGFGLPLVRDMIELWVPVFVSDRILKEEETAQRGFGDRIRFVLALEQLDPTRIVRAIKP